MCVVDNPSTVIAYDATGHMTPDFCHEPELVYTGTRGGDSLVWSGEIEHDGLKISSKRDFDDDDLVSGAS